MKLSIEVDDDGFIKDVELVLGVPRHNAFKKIGYVTVNKGSKKYLEAYHNTSRHKDFEKKIDNTQPYQREEFIIRGLKYN